MSWSEPLLFEVGFGETSSGDETSGRPEDGASREAVARKAATGRHGGRSLRHGGRSLRHGGRSLRHGGTKRRRKAAGKKVVVQAESAWGEARPDRGPIPPGVPWTPVVLEGGARGEKEAASPAAASLSPPVEPVVLAQSFYAAEIERLRRAAEEKERETRALLADLKKAAAEIADAKRIVAELDEERRNTRARIARIESAVKRRPRGILARLRAAWEVLMGRATPVAALPEVAPPHPDDAASEPPLAEAA